MKKREFVELGVGVDLSGLGDCSHIPVWIAMSRGGGIASEERREGGEGGERWIWASIQTGRVYEIRESPAYAQPWSLSVDGVEVRVGAGIRARARRWKNKLAAQGFAESLEREEVEKRSVGGK